MELSIILGVAQVIIGAFATVLWFNFKDVKAKAEKASDDLAEFKTVVAQTYVTDRALRETLSDIKEMFKDYESKMDARLTRIEEKLDEVRSKQ